MSTQPSRPRRPRPGSHNPLDKIREQARRYLEAAHGKDVWYRAPETFDNVLERWIWAVASREPEAAEQAIRQIERAVHAARKAGKS